MYDIEFTSEAIEDLKSFRKFGQQTIISGIDTQLRYEPAVETRNRMRPNDVAEWEDWQVPSVLQCGAECRNCQY